MICKTRGVAEVIRRLGGLFAEFERHTKFVRSPAFSTLDLLSHVCGDIFTAEIFVDVGVFDAHLLLVGLTLIKTCGRSFGDDGFGCAEISQMLVIIPLKMTG